MANEQFGSDGERIRVAVSQPNYLFVPMDVEGKAENHTQRRSHVMQHHNRRLASTQHLEKQLITHKASSLAKAQRNFRLSRAGLEQRPLHGSGRKDLESIALQLKAALSDSTPSDLADQSGAPTPDFSQLVSTRTLNPDEAQFLLRLSTSPLVIFGVSRIDPFGVLPVKLSPSDERLVNQFCQYEKWPWCPVSGQSLWGPFALSDELVFSATMYTWSMGIRSRLAGSFASSWLQDNPNIARHRLSTISLINGRIGVRSRAVADETIAAVAALTNLELLFGSRDMAAKHMDGLRALVDMRGGISTFVTSLQLLIRRLITWSDMMYSEMFSTPLAFPPSEIWDDSWNNFNFLALPGSPMGLSPLALRNSGVSHHEVIDLLHATRHLCELEQNMPLKRAKERDRMERGDMFLKVEGRLMVIVQSIPAHDLHHNGLTWKAISLTLLIFVHHILRGSSLRLRPLQLLVLNLQQTLSRMTNLFEELAFARSLLFWVLAVGALVSAQMSSNGWFVEALASVCKRYSMDWLKLRALLMGFLWTGPADEQRYLEVWHKIEKTEL